jgi:hypothetical protein
MSPENPLSDHDQGITWEKLASVLKSNGPDTAPKGGDESVNVELREQKVGDLSAPNIGSS